MKMEAIHSSRTTMDVTELHVVTTREIILFIVYAVRTSNPKKKSLKLININV
jgi:hypothetical protein